MLFIYAWVVAVSILIAMLIYQAYEAHSLAEEIRAEQMRDLTKFYEYKQDVSQRMKRISEDTEHQHNHIQRLESSLQDLKAKKSRKKKSN